MKIDKKNLAKINKHVLEQFPKEAVIGIDDNDELVFFENVHPDPENFFRIDPMKFHRSDIKILLHSHCLKRGQKCIAPDGSYYDPRTPSYEDMELQRSLDILFGIVSTSGEDVSEPVFFPDYEARIEGNDYISGVHDCLSVIQRHYWQEHNIIIPDFPREVGFWYENRNFDKHRKHSIDLYEENYKKVGFKEVSMNEIEPSDLILMAIMGERTTHGAIYLGNDKIVHHLTNRLSGEDSLPRWRKKVKKVLRHEKLL